MRKRTLVFFLLCVALFTAIPLSIASAAPFSTQITGQGELVVTGSYSAGIPNQGVPAEMDVNVYNQNGQLVYSTTFLNGYGGGSFYANTANLPSGTYTVSLLGPRLIVSNLQIYFK
ncbi:T9SS type A sorting domain-containing protein [Paenibacillus sp. ACRRX]|uniref:T9SS type A sorting domain-containing protein n=1 Tax=unclassified Paenibacillus TaxID=185978 RepID=UPI001EF49063|nr:MULTISPECIES: T9SS type A sorting domain-containing protein [unclassified Paenibacillus]MCG7406939.1 T9SS type A sorting domain-containing protein [Paenibacillus sp. ACRRX]MDK8179874.1 T9SS type A sorting domain-containing protein [Paenibacillus sp. UMB4589-SE434]